MSADRTLSPLPGSAGWSLSQPLSQTLRDGLGRMRRRRGGAHLTPSGDDEQRSTGHESIEDARNDDAPEEPPGDEATGESAGDDPTAGAEAPETDDAHDAHAPPEPASQAGPDDTAPSTTTGSDISPSDGTESEGTSDSPDSVDDLASSTAAQGAQPESLTQMTRAAMRSLPVPAPGGRFWLHLDDALAGDPSLGVAARPAIRPITEMPGGSAMARDKSLFKRNGRVSRFENRSPGGSGKARRRVIGTVVLVVVAGALVAGSLLGGTPDDVTTDTTAPPEDQAETAPAPTQVEGQPAPPSTPPPLAGLEPSVPLTPGGVGPLEAGSMALRDVASDVTEPQIDLPTFEGLGGTCYDARLPGAPDLILRARSADPTQGVEDPLDGILSSITITADLGSSRETEAGIGLGSSEELLLERHAGELVSSENPFVPGGHIYLYRAPDGSGNGIAYVTDGRQVREISVGAADAIRQPQPC